MDERVAKLKTPAECECFAKNARERDRPDLADEARKRAVALRAEAYGTTSNAERQCLKAIYAYEEVLTARNGRKTKASRTWQMLKRYGILGAVERAVNRPEEAVGYTALLEMGLQEYAFEAVVVHYPDLFSSEAVQRSRARLDEWKRT